MIRILVTLMLAFCTVHLLHAQNFIRGRIVDSKEAVPYATVLLLGADSSFLTGTTSDEAGDFVFGKVAHAKYIISVTAVGYEKFVTEPFVVNEDVVLPQIVINESREQLQEVIVTAEKPVFEQKSDRIIINTENSATSGGNSVLEILQKSPGVVVNRQSSSITINGRSGVRIMMNGKVLQVPTDVAVQMLDGMSSAQVESIELISSPDSKFDADGSGGVIAIVTKTDMDLGTSATFGVTTGAKWAEVWGSNASFTQRRKKFGYSIDVSHLSTHNMHVTKLRRQSIQDPSVHAYTYSPRENFTGQQNLNASMEWKVSKKTAVNFGLVGYRRNWKLQGTAEDTDYRKLDTVVTNMKVAEINRWQSVITSLGVTSKLSDRSELSLSFDHLYYHNHNPSDYENSVENRTTPKDIIVLNKSTPINTFVSRVDYANSSSEKVAWDVGVKAVRSTLDNEVTAENLEGDVWVTNSEFSSSSSLKEYVLAAYASANWKTSDIWNINGGLRYEYTNTMIRDHTLQDDSGDQSIDRKYGYFFPSLSLTRKIDDSQSLSVFYAKRLTRPTYNDIAPFVFIWSPGIFSAGNTGLLPAISNGVTVTYKRMQWTTSMQYTRVDNEIVPLQPEPAPVAEGIIYRTHNMKWFETALFGNSISAGVTKWWEMHGNVSLMFQRAETSHLPVNVIRKRGVINVYFTNSIKLPKNSSVELSATFQSTAFFGISYFMPVGSINFGIQKTFGKNNILRLAADDILNTNNWKIFSSIPRVLSTSFDYHWYNRYIRLTYTWKLGNRELRTVRGSAGSEEERKRVE